MKKGFRTTQPLWILANGIEWPCETLATITGQIEANSM